MAETPEHSNHKKLKAILAKALEDFKPTDEEIAETVAYSNDIVARLKKALPRSVEIMAVGSFARGTQMRGSSDIDIFLLFPKNLSKDYIGKVALDAAKKIVKGKNESYEVKYAEHPYAKLSLKDLGITADIVPAYNIKNFTEMGTAVDRTPLHNKFVSSNLTQRQKDDVILLKAFLKMHDLKGADAKTEGFSGYLCELLTYNYGSFMDTLVHISKLKLPVVITPFNRTVLHGDSEQMKKMVKKFGKQFIVIDPTDENRNVAAAVSDESLARFVLISKIFLKKPSYEFFNGPKYSDVYSERKLLRLKRELGLDVYLLHIKVPDISEDILWQQVRRLQGRMSATLSGKGFPPILSFENVQDGDAVLAFFLQGAPKLYSIVDGPSAYMGESAERFMEAHEESLGMIFKKDRISSIEHSKVKTANQAMLEAMRSMDSLPSYIKKKNIKLYVNDMPESLAKLLYSALMKKTRL